MVLKIVKDDGKVILVDSKNVTINDGKMSWEKEAGFVYVESVEAYDGKYFKLEE